MHYQKPTFTLPAAPPKITEEQWAAIWEATKTEYDSQATVKVGSYRDFTFTPPLSPERKAARKRLQDILLATC